MAKAGPTAVRVETMRLEAMKLVNQGFSCPAIGEILGISRVRAWTLINEELEAIAAETLQEALEWRLKLTARHEARLASLAAIAERAVKKEDLSAELSAIQRGTAIDVEIGKLWGAPAPSKAELSGPNGGPLEVQGAFAVPIGTVDADNWTAAALAQAVGEEDEAERVLGKKPKAVSNETTPAR